MPIIKATEASGYKGIYSIEFYGKPPKDVVAAARDMITALSAQHQRVGRRAGAWIFSALALRRDRQLVVRLDARRQHAGERVLVQQLVGNPFQRRHERGRDHLIVTSARFLGPSPSTCAMFSVLLALSLSCICACSLEMPVPRARCRGPLRAERWRRRSSRAPLFRRCFAHVVSRRASWWLRCRRAARGSPAGVRRRRTVPGGVLNRLHQLCAAPAPGRAARRGADRR